MAAKGLGSSVPPLAKHQFSFLNISLMVQRLAALSSFASKPCKYSRHIMKRISAAIMFATLAASPAFAQPLDHPWADGSGVHISSERAEALRECSTGARQIPEHYYEESDLLINRACMNDRW
jgi:hypothetical protein